MGQANVKRWVDDIMPLLGDDDPLGVDDFATHRLPLDEAPRAYEMFQKKEDGAIKVALAARRLTAEHSSAGGNASSPPALELRWA